MSEIGVLGAVSKRIINKIGTGTTTQKVESLTYFFAEKNSNGDYYVRTLSAENKPTGQRIFVPKDEFDRDYFIEPEKNLDIFPMIRKLEEHLMKGEEFREEDRLYQAKFEYEQALELDEGHIKAKFGLALNYIQINNFLKAKEIFDSLRGLGSLINYENKHMLNDFGISLRKLELYDQSIHFYQMALDLVQDDENLFYNIAIAYSGKKTIL